MEKVKSAEDIALLIKRVEKNFNTQSWSVAGLDIWPVLRISVYYELSLGLLQHRPVNFSSSLTKQLKRAFNILLSAFSPLDIKDVLLVSDGISYVNLGGKGFYDRFCDPFIEILEKKNIGWSKWNLLKDRHLSNISRPAQNILAKSDFQLLVGSKEIVELPSEVNDFLGFLKTETADNISWSLKNIKEKIQRLLILKKWFVEKLKRNRPKLILIVSYYSERGIALISACWELNIPIADIQHGVQGRMHMAYAGWEKPLKGYFNTLPQDFLVWNEDDMNTINEWAHETSHDVFTTGNIMQHNWKLGNSELISEFDKRITSIKSRFKAKITILFTLQYGVIYEDKLFKMIARIEHDVLWAFRFHPMMSDQEKSFFLKKIKIFGITNYEYKNASLFPLYSWLRNVNLHFTHSSSTVLEAADFGVNSIIYHHYGVELFENQIEIKKAFFIEHSEDLMKVINRLSRKEYSLQLQSASTHSLYKNEIERFFERYV